MIRKVAPASCKPIKGDKKEPGRTREMNVVPVMTDTLYNLGDTVILKLLNSTKNVRWSMALICDLIID